MFGWKKKATSDEIERAATRKNRDREIADLKGKLEGYESNLRKQYGDLDRIKDEIAGIEKALAKKKLEWDALTGERKRIVASEIKSLADRLELQRGETRVVEDKIGALNVLIARAKESIQVLSGTEISADAQDVAVTRREAEEERRREESAVAELRRAGGESKSEEDFDVDAYFSKLEQESGCEPSTLDAAESPRGSEKDALQITISNE